MSVKSEVNKIKTKVASINEAAKANFDKLEVDTRSALAEALTGYSAIQDSIQQEVAKVELAIEEYFKSKEFLTLGPEQAQYDMEVRAELKHHNHWNPNEGEYCVNVNAINWNSRTAAAALRQDPDKHLTITPVAKHNQRALQEVVLAEAGGEAAKLLPKLESLEAEKRKVDIEIGKFKDHNEFYSTVLIGVDHG